MNAIIILLAAVFLSGQPQKSPLTLSGVVTDSKTHLPIEGAHVSLVGNLATHDVDTDVNGNFILVLSGTVQPAQIVRLLVKKDSYKTYGRDISVAPALTLQVPLDSAAIRKPSPSPPKRSLYVRGSVSTGNGAAVVGAEVLIHGGPSSKPTNKAGEFRIEDITLVPDYGWPVTFGVVDPVEPKVTWIVDDPKTGGFGRTYLPSPSAEPIRLHVLKAGDPAFLQESSITGILGQRVFFFGDDETRFSSGDSRAGAAPSVRAKQPEFHAVSLNAGATSFLGVRQGTASGFRTEGGQQDKSDWDRFLSQKAAEIHIPLKELLSAVGEWAAANHMGSPYQEALADLYHGHYDRAFNDFQSLLNPENRLLQEQLFMSLAYTEFKRGNFAESSRYLKELARLHPQDTLVQRNLAIVGRKEESFARSKAVDRKRLEICRNVMGYFARDEVLMLRSLFDTPMAASASEHGIGRLYDEVTKNAGGFQLILEQSAESQPSQPTKYVTKSRFEKGEIEMVVSFDDHNLIDRITFLDPLTHTEWGFPR
jgi:hypothetical protein